MVQIETFNSVSVRRVLSVIPNQSGYCWKVISYMRITFDSGAYKDIKKFDYVFINLKVVLGLLLDKHMLSVKCLVS